MEEVLTLPLTFLVILVIVTSIPSPSRSALEGYPVLPGSVEIDVIVDSCPYFGSNNCI